MCASCRAFHAAMLHVVADMRGDSDRDLEACVVGDLPVPTPREGPAELRGQPHDLRRDRARHRVGSAAGRQRRRGVSTGSCVSCSSQSGTCSAPRSSVALATAGDPTLVCGHSGLLPASIRSWSAQLQLPNRKTVRDPRCSDSCIYDERHRQCQNAPSRHVAGKSIPSKRIMPQQNATSPRGDERQY